MSAPADTDWRALGLDYGLGKNAFQAARERPLPPELTPEQIKIEAHRRAMLAKYHAGQALKIATRINKNNFHIANPEESQRALDTQRRIVGKSNGARSQ